MQEPEQPVTKSFRTQPNKNYRNYKNKLLASGSRKVAENISCLGVRQTSPIRLSARNSDDKTSAREQK